MFIRFLSFCFVLFAFSPFTLAAETYFEVVDNEENIFLGTIAALDRTQIVIDVQGSIQTIPLEKLTKIRNLVPSPYQGVTVSNTSHKVLLQPVPGQSALSGQKAGERRHAALIEAISKKLQLESPLIKKTFPDTVIALELKDGSRLTASAFSVTKNQGVCQLLDQQNDLILPLDTISAVRFTVRNLLEVINPPEDWQRLAIPNAGGDRLIVGNPGSFEVYAGILNEISAETISFTVDGETLPVPRRKVYGLVLHGDTPVAPAVSALATPPLAALMLWTGTLGMASDMQLKDNELTWNTSSGLAVAIPLSMVSEIDFGEKGIAYLVDCEQVRSEFSLPTARSGIVPDLKPQPLKLLQTFYESRTKNSTREIVLDGVVYNRGITLLGKSLLEYRLPKSFSALKAVIGIEDQFRPYASADLQILADSQLLGTWRLRGDTASQRIQVNLPQNCQSIIIIAEPSPQSEVPTVLTIADPKVFE